MRPFENVVTCPIKPKVMSELRYYLLDKGEPDPWNYAQYHCTTAANLYSAVHGHLRELALPVWPGGPVPRSLTCSSVLQFLWPNRKMG